MSRKFIVIDKTHYNLDHIVSVDERGKNMALSNGNQVKLTYSQLCDLLNLMHKKWYE